jgi:hypothetical protein
MWLYDGVLLLDSFLLSLAIVLTEHSSNVCVCWGLDPWRASCCRRVHCEYPYVCLEVAIALRLRTVP